jgi:hypothetical protein
MADDSAGQAIEIIGALQGAGLLRAAPTTSEPAAQIITALSDAGLLATSPSTAEPAARGRALADAVSVAPSTEPEPKVDDEAYLGDVRRITTTLLSGSGQVVLRTIPLRAGKAITTSTFRRTPKTGYRRLTESSRHQGRGYS